MVKNLPAMQETQEMWVQPMGWEDPLEKEMATHSSILRAWRIPQAKEPGGLRSSIAWHRGHVCVCVCVCVCACARARTLRCIKLSATL